MKKLNFKEAIQRFNEFFNSAKKEMFKTEVLQDYSAIDNGPSLRAWLEGDKEKSKELFRDDKGSQTWIKNCLKSPARITRVHIINKPLTSYLGWEIEVCYKELLKTESEKIYLVSKEKVQHIDIPDGDFWIFDNKKVVKFEYQGPKGKCVGGVIYDENDDINKFLKLKDEFMKVAEKL